ncbi:Phosphatidylinositol 4,5-bisphosphate 3-kinase catalytic subunit delta isoform [Nymphon striatum]|nr:Phosphatidylinositol 4,5-bisphosphate 3-kinase catalytic subunit delta isoform [Nymphon striatum]
MSPVEFPLSVWTQIGDKDTINIDFLMPNGLLIPLQVTRDATLLEIKDELWEEARKYPLYGTLHDSQHYVFLCVNQTTAEQEELVDEMRHVCDVRPFLAVLKVVEKKNDKAEKLLNAQIGLLIGKSLHEFDSLKNPEVNDFRWKMRVICEEIAEERRKKKWLEKVLYQFPLRLAASAELPEALSDRFIEGNFIVIVRFENTEASFSISVHHRATCKELLTSALNKKSHMTGIRHPNSNSYVLKVCGLQEFLLGDHPICQFLYIQDMLRKNETPQLLINSTRNIPVAQDEDPYVNLSVISPRTSTLSNTATLRKKMKTTPSISFTNKFTFHIDSASRLNIDENSRSRSHFGIEIGLFHGGEPLCDVISTNEVDVPNGEAVWDEDITFDIEICNIPRCARLCIAIYELKKVVKGTVKSRRRDRSTRQDLNMRPIGWINTMIYDFRNCLKSGPETLYLWTSMDDMQTEDLLHPIATITSNPNMEHATALTVCFDDCNSSQTIIYPSLENLAELNEGHSQEQDSGRNSVPHASKAYLQQVKQICERDPLHQMHEQEKELLWFLRKDCCIHFPHVLPKLLHAVKWNDQSDIAEMMALLQVWPSLPPEKALELLDYAYADINIRNFAVKCLKNLSDEELSMYLLQLVQALKHESYLYCDLAKFLLSRALNNQVIGQNLFWHLRSELHVPSVSVRFRLVLECYCRGATDHMKQLLRQMEALNKLKIASDVVKQDAIRRKDGREKLKSKLQETLVQKSYADNFFNLISPLNPYNCFRSFKIDECAFRDSKMKPLWLVFENYDSCGNDIFIMYKNGDDLRQDMLTLQMIRIMDKLWKEEGLDLRMNAYRCIATDNKVGLIEVVLHAETIANIQKDKGIFTATSAFKKGSLLAWLKDHNSDEKGLSAAVEEFTLSCAGYCVATYILGIADRHSDNIMVKTNGQLFHIDFGHILGKFKEKFGIRRERVPFVLTHDFVHVITRGHTQKSQEFSRFQQYCEQAFMILRRKGSLIISLFALMLSTGIPELSCEKDLDYLRETLVLELTEAEALRHFRSKFDEALRNSWKTSLNWVAHNLAKDNITK